MEQKAQTKRVAFCCPHHGVLQVTVKYFSENLGTRMLVDVPVMYCPKCEKYYTPFNNLLTLFNLRYKGHQVMPAKGRVERSVPKVEIKVPHFVDIEEVNKQNEQLRMERAEKYKQYVEGLRTVPHDSIVLTNKPHFINENKCPRCYETLKTEHIKITQHRKFLLAKLKHCSHCETDYIAQQQFDSICTKAHEKIRGHFHEPFISPAGIRCEEGDDGKYLFIPEWALDFTKYDHHHMPPKGDGFYDMTDEEYHWVRLFYQPEEFSVQLRQKSFLGEAG